LARKGPTDELFVQAAGFFRGTQDAFSFGIVATEALIRQEKRMLKASRTNFTKENFDAHVDALLDDALKATFPASDPIALAASRRSEVARREEELIEGKLNGLF
jgi:hypothetical protein